MACFFKMREPVFLDDWCMDNAEIIELSVNLVNSTQAVPLITSIEVIEKQYTRLYGKDFFRNECLKRDVF